MAIKDRLKTRLDKVNHISGCPLVRSGPYMLDLVFIVAANRVAQASRYIKRTDAQTDESSLFKIQLSATAQAPATHFAQSWLVSEAQFDQLEGHAGPAVDNGQVKVFDGNFYSIDSAAAELRLQRIIPDPAETIAAIRASIAAGG